MSKRIIGAVLAAVFAATLGTAAVATAAVSAAATSTAVAAGGDPTGPTEPPSPCPDPTVHCDDDDYGWTLPGD
ncbi:hypothetical protein ACQPYE_22790 [Actinosynnema sp. CA-299493]